jgi:hypothetical protein
MDLSWKPKEETTTKNFKKERVEFDPVVPKLTRFDPVVPKLKLNLILSFQIQKI